jgi:hypothetical protein
VQRIHCRQPATTFFLSCLVVPHVSCQWSFVVPLHMQQAQRSCAALRFQWRALAYLGLESAYKSENQTDLSSNVA